MRHRGVREGLPGDADADAAGRPDRVRPEHRLLPSRLDHVLSDELAAKPTRRLAVAEQLLDAVDAVDGLRVGGEDLAPELVRGAQHVLAPATQGRRGALERVTAVEQDGLVGPLHTDP